VIRIVTAVILCTTVASAAPHKKHKPQHADTRVVAQVDLEVPVPGPAPPPAVLLTPTPPPQPEYETRREHRWGLFGGGLALFLAGYALDIGISYGLDHHPAATAFIPVIGPLVQMGDSWAMVAPSNSGNAQVDAEANARIDSINHTIQTAAIAVLAVDFVLQLAGTTMAVIGAVGHTERYEIGTSRVAVVPTANGLAVRF
jgi:hypothetical protein